jgi:hypothetical protein
MSHCAESIFEVEELREYESIFETALAHESADPGVQFDEKNQRSKSRKTVPLRNTGVCALVQAEAGLYWIYFKVIFCVENM